MSWLDDVSWQARAACAGGDAELFFGPDGEGPQEQDNREVKAAAVCRRCPVRGPCLDYALRNSIREGVWGGLTKEGRSRERRRRGRASLRGQPVMHGIPRSRRTPGMTTPVSPAPGSAAMGPVT